MRQSNSNGFTLIELLISMAIFGTVMALAGSAYINNLKSSVTQQELSQMNQNLRAALDLMTSDIKLAGLDPSGEAKSRIITGKRDEITFSMDFTGGLSDGKDNDDDGVTDEGIDGADNNVNGYVDEPDEAESYDGDTNDDEIIRYTLAGNRLSRLLYLTVDDVAANNPKVSQTVALNIDALDFVYLKEDGTFLPIPLAGLPPEDIVNINAVQLSIVARTNASRYVTPNSQLYKNQQGDEIFPITNDGRRRTMVSTEIVCRNINLTK